MSISFVTPVVDPVGPEGAVASALARDVEPFATQVIGYDTVVLTWKAPAVEAWLGIQVVRSRSGFPRTPDDGLSVLLFEQPGWNEQNSYTVAGLPGGYHYFSLFLKNAFGWHRVAEEDALVPYDYSSTDRMWDNIPEYYRVIRDDTADMSLVNLRINADLYDDIAGGSAPNLLLSAFISLFGWGFDLLRTQAEYLMSGYDPSVIHTSRLRLLSQQFGHTVETSVPAHVNRTIVRNLASLYRNRGTLDGIRDIMTAVSGWDVEVSIGPNRLLSEDQAAFVNPTPPTWDPTVNYDGGHMVRHGDFTFQSIGSNNIGYANMPPATATSNAFWTYVAYPYANIPPSPVTGDISTWQLRVSPFGDAVSGQMRGAYGAPDVTGTKQHTNVVRVWRGSGSDGSAWIEAMSVPAISTPTKTARQHILESGIPIPRPVQWDVEREYRAGEFVIYKGAAYEALNTVVGVVPTSTADWLRVGYDDRISFTFSGYAHGPFTGTAGTGGKTVTPKAYTYSGAGVVVQAFEWTPTSAVPFFDPFVDDNTLLNGSRNFTNGFSWGSDNVGTWSIDRNDNGGFVTPPTSGKSHRWFSHANGLVSLAVTFTADPPTAGQRIGIIFRRSDNNNYWIAHQSGLYKIVAGAARAVPASGALTWTKFTTGQRLRVNLNGNVISVYKDGTLLGTATDSFNSTATSHGLGVED